MALREVSNRAQTRRRPETWTAIRAQLSELLALTPGGRFATLGWTRRTSPGGAMARVFVSHSSTDAVLAAEVHRWLVDDGHEAFLDQDLADGILAGEEWQQRLHERLRWADAVVCVLTAAYIASPWCSAELGIAQSRGSRLLPVQAEAGVRHPLLNSVQYVDMTVDAAAARARVTEALLEVDAAGGFGWPDDRSPFPGLRPLDTDEHSVFFGRAREVDQLVALLRSPAEQAERAVLLVVGPSGCGKSSQIGRAHV